VSNAPILEIITIGREILDGRVVDTNAARIAERIGTIGLTPRHGTRVDDDRARMLDAFRLADSRADIVVATGGLGPTSDDLTAAAFAEFLGEKPTLNPDALRQVEAAFARMQRPMTEVQRKQARLAPSCFVIENPVGTAPGFGLARQSARGPQLWFFLPGVPREMLAMLETSVLPRLPARPRFRVWTWATQFTSEGRLAEQLAPVEAKLPAGFEVTYRTRFPENHVGLYGDLATPEFETAFDALRDEITRTLGAEAFWSGPDLASPTLESLALDEARRLGWKFASIESCTGGLIAACLTEVPGASTVIDRTDLAGASEAFWFSEVVYDNAAKKRLGVTDELLRTKGAVSKEVALALAQAGRQALVEMGAAQAACLATTGIAGPGGGSAEKAVGLCHVALALPDGSLKHEEVQGRPGLSRSDYKLLFSQKALNLLYRNLG